MSTSSSSVDFTIALIVAAARNGVIGRGGVLPWRMPSDLKTFRRLTMGKPVVMGRKTYASIGKPLDGRDNIVVTRDVAFRADGVEVATSPDAGIALARVCAAKRGAHEIMIIGGAEIYAAARGDADRIYLTRIDAEPEGDARFADPEPGAWRLVRRETIQRGPKDDFAAELQVYERMR